MPASTNGLRSFCVRSGATLGPSAPAILYSHAPARPCRTLGMKGYLTVCQGPEEPEVYELVKGQRISIGGGSGNSIQAGKSAPPQVAFLEWQGRAASWSITPGEGAEGKISLNRQHLPTAAFLRDQDI